MPNKMCNLLTVLYISVMIMLSISIIGCLASLWFESTFTSKDYFVIILLLIIFILLFTLLFYLLKWEDRGKETFILEPNKLEHIIVIKPFKTEKHIFDFKKLSIGYQSGQDFYTEEEARLKGVEPNLDKVAGNYSIQFYMDDGLKVVDSEREIPIEVIRKIKGEYFL